MKLDLGCGLHPAPGFIGMDRSAAVHPDVVHDMEDLPWPFPSDSVEEVRASHSLEHVHDLLGVMEEIHRVLKPGGLLTAIVPYYRNERAFMDPTHVRFFTEHTMGYFRPGDGYNYYSTARFDVLQAQRVGPFCWHVDHHLPPSWRPLAHRLLSRPGREIRFVLRCVKDPVLR